MYALKQEQKIEIIQFLLDIGYDVNIQNKKGETPLMRAIQNSCKFEVIQLLIQYEANVNMLTNDGRNIFDFFTTSEEPP